MRARLFGFAVSVLAVLVLAPTATALAAGRAPAGTGYDVSYPQCADPLPVRPSFGIVGVNDGRPYGDNPCLAAEYGWARTSRTPPGFYMNTGNPGVASSRVDWYGQAGPRPCSPDDEASCSYDFGYNGARLAFDDTQALTGAAGDGAWWLDVETGNSWSGDAGLNLAALQGSIDALGERGVTVGIYSSAWQWGQITGGAWLGMPTWVAGAADAHEAAGLCFGGFTGGRVRLVQYGADGIDADLAC